MTAPRAMTLQSTTSPVITGPRRSRTVPPPSLLPNRENASPAGRNKATWMPLCYAPDKPARMVGTTRQRRDAAADIAEPGGVDTSGQPEPGGEVSGRGPVRPGSGSSSCTICSSGAVLTGSFVLTGREQTVSELPHDA